MSLVLRKLQMETMTVEGKRSAGSMRPADQASSVLIPLEVVCGSAWRAVSLHARAVLIELLTCIRTGMPCEPSNLAQGTRSTKPRVTAALAELEAQGLVEGTGSCSSPYRPAFPHGGYHGLF